MIWTWNFVFILCIFEKKIKTKGEISKGVLLQCIFFTSCWKVLLGNYCSHVLIKGAKTACNTVCSILLPISGILEICFPQYLLMRYNKLIKLQQGYLDPLTHFISLCFHPEEKIWRFQFHYCAMVFPHYNQMPWMHPVALLQHIIKNVQKHFDTRTTAVFMPPCLFLYFPKHTFSTWAVNGILCWI